MNEKELYRDILNQLAKLSSGLDTAQANVTSPEEAQSVKRLGQHVRSTQIYVKLASQQDRVLESQPHVSEATQALKVANQKLESALFSSEVLNVREIWSTFQQFNDILTFALPGTPTTPPPDEDD